MGKNRIEKLYKIFNFTFKFYAWFFCIFFILTGLTYFMEENYDELCDIVPLDQFYHFRSDIDEGCDIKWLYLLREYVFVFFIVFAPPALLLFGIRALLKKKMNVTI